MRYSHRYTVVGLLSIFVGLAELLLSLRVILRFFNGNPDAAFIEWVYRNTQPLLEPFRAVFPQSWNDVGPGWNIDYPALFAMAAYPVIAAVLLSLAGGWALKSWMDWGSADSRKRK